MQTFRNA